VPQLGAELLARGLQLAPDPAHAARPRVLAERVDHGPADPPLGKGLELDPTAVVEAMGGVDETDDAVLDQVAQVDRMRHRRRHPSRQCLHEGQSSLNAVDFCGCLDHSFAHPPNPGSGSPPLEATRMPALCTGVEDWAIWRPNFVSL